MLERVTPKMQVGQELLECGLQMYFDGAYFAALHLAGGADEILGGYVTRGGTDSAFEGMRAGALRISAYIGGPPATEKGITHVMNYARNRTKHLDEEGDDEILFDPKREAEDMLGRALTNYFGIMSRLPLEETELMRRFKNEQRWQS
ncbi:hypothetical protein [Massilia sp. 9096]|uniref:hypothetical protein n=1 Tax=Massilia sp. 9096 TaxID=1500894 RepID=UPI00056A25B8|nr:hypothetical protein [Massilia sp. 9096]